MIGLEDVLDAAGQVQDFCQARERCTAPFPPPLRLRVFAVHLR